MNGVVAGKSSEGPVETNVFGGRRSLQLLRARDTGAVGADVQAASLVVDAVGAGAGGDGELEGVLVLPALEVVGVQAVAGGVAVGVDEAVEVLDRAGVVEELVEDREDGLGVRLRAHAGVVVANSREGDLSCHCQWMVR